MPFNQSCPGSLSIREPMPEYVSCPTCHQEVEIWSNELSYPCPKCGTRVARKQTPSCIDWCPMAEECIGSELYKQLKPEERSSPSDPVTNGVVNTLRREHDEAQKQIALLKAAVLCLGASAKASSPYPAQVIEQSMVRVRSVLTFFDREMRLHFRREEDDLFPALDGHIGREGSPSRVLLVEHVQVWELVDCLKEGLGKLAESEGKESRECAAEVYGTATNLARLLESHIKKENESLLPIAQSLLESREIEGISRRWESLKVEAV